MPPIDLSAFQIDLSVIIVIAVGAAIFLAIAIVWGIRAHRLRIEAGKEEMVGRIAEVMTDMEPRGIVFIEGERWTAVSEDGWVEAGEEVVITRVDGLRLYVTRKK